MPQKVPRSIAQLQHQCQLITQHWEGKSEERRLGKARKVPQGRYDRIRDSKSGAPAEEEAILEYYPHKNLTQNYCNNLFYASLFVLEFSQIFDYSDFIRIQYSILINN